MGTAMMGPVLRAGPPRTGGDEVMLVCAQRQGSKGLMSKKIPNIEECARTMVETETMRVGRNWRQAALARCAAMRGGVAKADCGDINFLISILSTIIYQILLKETMCLN